MMKPGEKYEILETFTYMQKGLLEIERKDDILLAFCEGSTEQWWNYGLLRTPISEGRLKLIEKYFLERKRKSSVYFTEDLKDGMIELLQKRGYAVTSKDSWMFWNRSIPNIDSKGIIKVSSDEDFSVWIETFLKSYPKDDPKNPYGEQDTFANVLKKNWNEKRTQGDVYYTVIHKNKPVAVGCLTTRNNMGYISAIGSIPEARGKGFGKKITLFCVQESFSKGNKMHFLATEKGDFPYEFYNRIGFDTDFVAYVYTKE